MRKHEVQTTDGLAKFTSTAWLLVSPHTERETHVWFRFTLLPFFCTIISLPPTGTTTTITPGVGVGGAVFLVQTETDQGIARASIF